MTTHPIPMPAVGGWDLASECQGLAVDPDKTCLHVLARWLRRSGWVPISPSTTCPACLAALSAAVEALALDPPVNWPDEVFEQAGEWSYVREPEPAGNGFARGVVRSNLAPGEKL